MADEEIIKKDAVIFVKSLFKTERGDLVLTPTRLYFVAVKKGLFSRKEEEILNIPIEDIINVKAEKAFWQGTDYLRLLYKDDGKEKKVLFQHFSWARWSAGDLSRVEALYFAPWENAIEELRSGKQERNTEFDELRELAELKEKGIVTEEEFNAKKKQILGL